MKPYLLATLEYAPQVGGVAEYLAAMVSQFPAGSMEVLAPEIADAHKHDVESPSVIYRRRLLSSKIRPAWAPAFAAISKLLGRAKYSGIIVSHVLPMGLIARTIGAAHRTPYIVVAHGMDVALALSAGGRKRTAAAHVLNHAEMVIANSAYTAGLVRSFGVKPEKIQVAHPVPGRACRQQPSEEQIQAVRAKHKLDGSFVVMSIGRLVARKGFDVCLDAVLRLRRDGVNAKYVIVGDGPERARLMRLVIETGAEGIVEFAGRVSAEDLPAYHATADVFVTVPRSLGPDVEGFGIVFLEANLYGKPVIGSRIGGVPEAIVDGQTGLLVNPDNPVELAAALRRLAGDAELRRTLGEQGRARVLAEFTAEKQFGPVVQQLLAARVLQR